MEAEVEYNINDLIRLSNDQKPVDFEKAFGSVIADRLAAAVDNKKIEVAATMFGSSEPEVEPEVEPEEANELEDTEQTETPEEEQNGEAA